MRRCSSGIRTILRRRRVLRGWGRRLTLGSLKFRQHKVCAFMEPFIILHELRVVIVHEPELQEQIVQDIMLLRGAIRACKTFLNDWR